MKNPIKFWLIFVFLLYVLPWWKTVYFQWDDIELLMQLRSPQIVNFFTPHSYQFVPLFLLFYWLEIQIFGVTPSLFFLVSVLIHLTNIYLVYRLILMLTKKENLAMLAGILVSFNKSFYTIIFWPTMQTQQILLTFTMLALMCFYKLQNKWSLKTFLWLIISLLGAVTAHSFSIPTGLILGLATTLFWPRNTRTRLVSMLTAATTLIGSMSILLFSSQQIQANGIAQNILSPDRLFKVIYFTAVGASQAIISRFFLPGFTPNIYRAANVAVMITIPSMVLLFMLISVMKSSRTKNPRIKLAPFFIFGGLLMSGYFMASLARSAPGAHKALTERYVYFPLFHFILLLVYSSSLIYNQIFKLRPTIKFLVIGSLTIIMIGHIIGLNFYVYHFFTSLR